MKKTTKKGEEKKVEKKEEGSKKEDEKKIEKKVKEKKVEKKEEKQEKTPKKTEKTEKIEKDETKKPEKEEKTEKTKKTEKIEKEETEKPKKTEKDEIEKTKKTTSNVKKTGSPKKSTTTTKKPSSTSGVKKNGPPHEDVTTKKKTKKLTTDDEPIKGGEDMTPIGVMKAEYNKWKKAGHDPDIKWVKANAEDCQVILNFGSGDSFSITYPETYPDCKDESFFVFGDGDSMDAWSDAMVEYTDKKLSFSELLTKCALKYQEVGGSSAACGGIEFDDEYGGVDIDEDFGFKEEKNEKKVYDPVEVEFSNKKFLEIGSPAASLRLIKDLKNIKRVDPKILGFSAEPRFEPGKNLENLYHWIVKLKFEGDLGKDLLESQKKFGIDYVELEMRFSESYPFQPPFVRVVRPRFKFHTGHVTLGGSICMELLTNSGWRSTNDIESILIQIRAEMQGGNARLDLGNTAQYSESEAWDAFYRAAKNHSWDIKNIGPNMFPNIK